MSTNAKREETKRYLDGQDDIKIRVPKGHREELKKIAKEKYNMSLQAFIFTAINEKLVWEIMKRRGITKQD
jgi:hypothetical protein